VTSETIGHYRIIKKLGAGGMGEVFLAEDTFLHRQVAIKFLSSGQVPQAGVIKHLLKEARAAARLDHPNICAIHDVRNDNSGNYIVMQYVDGESLASMLKKRRSFEIKEILSIGLQLSNAIAEAHARNVIHRDIKPQNIMIDVRDRVKVLDFGLARIDDQVEFPAKVETVSMSTNRYHIVGTPQYMSPEHMQPEDLDCSSDIFSLGIVLYEMIAGSHPFVRKTVTGTISAILSHEPPPLTSFRKDVPAGLDRLVRKCLEKDKSKRYEDGIALSTDISELINRLDRYPSVLGRLSSIHLKYAVLSLLLIALGFLGFQAIREASTKIVDSPKITHSIPTTLASVAVLPIRCDGISPELEYLCDGLTENIINRLSSVANLRVSPRTSVFRYKNREGDGLAAGRELNVKSIMTGKLAKQGDDLKIQIDLVDVETGSQIWGQQYTQKASSLLLIQDDISAQIAQRLRVQLSRDELSRLTKHYTDNNEAYMLYERGRFFWNRRTVEDLKKAVDSFEAAIKLDPNYALAYTGLADSYMIQTRYGVGPPKDLLERAKTAAEKAISIDEGLAEAHTSLAAIKADYDWDWPTIEREHRRAIELNPNYATAHNFYAWYLLAMGRPEEAKAEMQLALGLEPGSLSITASMGLPYYYSGDFDLAIAQYKKCLEMDSSFILAHWYLGMAYEQKGLYDEAIAQWNRIRSTDTSPELITNLGYSFAVSGRRDDALRCLADLQALAKERYVSAFQIGLIYLGLGNLDEAFLQFEKAYNDRSLPFTLNVDPRFKNLHSDPRFIKLLQHLRLAG
jgi:serine/threonine protein kinase/Tfp pilus assembly protein PilF